MEILTLLIPLALILGGVFVLAFIWSVLKGQFEDLETPGHRMLLEEKKSKKNSHHSKEKNELN